MRERVLSDRQAATGAGAYRLNDRVPLALFGYGALKMLVYCVLSALV